METHSFKMIANPRLLSLLYVTFLVFVESHMNVRRFGKHPTYGDRTGYTRRQSTRSKIQCAATCEQDDLCRKYLYDNNVCRMGESANGPGVMYKQYDNCPGERDYHLWIYDDMQLCLKYISSMMTQPTANSTCENDGGHMVLVEKLDERVRICDILTELGDTNGVWLDGYDISDGKKEFQTWKGKPMAWIEWAPGNPGSSKQDCLFARTDEGCQHIDLDCDDYENKGAALCQIDMI